MSEPLEIQVRDGQVFALNDPEVWEISANLIRDADPKILTVEGNELTFHFGDGDRRYRMVHVTTRGWVVQRT